MKKLIGIFVFVLFVFSVKTYSQEKAKLVRFSNITEVTVGFQVGKTTQLTSLPEGNTELEVAGYKIPSPRVNSSFGIIVGQIFFIGPGLGYMYQAGDSNNPFQHHVSAFGHARIHFAKGRFRPFVDLRGGYNHIVRDNVQDNFDKSIYSWDGAFAEPAIGFGFKLGGHAVLNTSVGYQFMNVWNRTAGLTNADGVVTEFRDSYHRLLLTVGFTFY